MLPTCCSLALTAVLGAGGAGSLRDAADRSASLAAVRVADALPGVSSPTPPSARRLVDGYEPSEGALDFSAVRDAERRTQRRPVADELAAGVALSGLTLDATGLTLFIQDRRTGRTRPVRATLSRRGVRLTVPF